MWSNKSDKMSLKEASGQNRTKRPFNHDRSMGLADRSDSPWQYVRILGRGSRAVVHKVKLTETNESLAQKIYCPISGQHFRNLKKDFEKEVDIMRRLPSGAHMIKLYQAFVQGSELSVLYSPVASDGDLAFFISQVSEAGPTPIQQDVLNQAFGCLASGLADIHKQKIRHKDIKPENILIHHGRVIYTDFGEAYNGQLDGTATTGFPGPFTQRYAAPEVVEYKERPTVRTSKSDIFSLGCVFLEILDALERSLGLRSDDRKPYYAKLEPVRNLLLASTTNTYVGALSQICHAMVDPDQVSRPAAIAVLREFTALGHTAKENAKSRHFCSECSAQLYDGSHVCEDESEFEGGISTLFLDDDLSTGEDSSSKEEMPTIMDPPTQLLIVTEEIVSTAPTSSKKGKKKKSNVVGFTFAEASPKPRKRHAKSTQRYYCNLCGSLGHDSSNCPNECWACGELYHKSADCPNKCWTCDEVGHFARDCPNECDACDEVGHTTEECPNKCWTCGGVGHFSNRCPDPCFICGRRGHDTLKCTGKCHGCGKVGHWRRDCGDACFECGQLGHWAAECPSKKSRNRRRNPGTRARRRY